MCTCYRGDDPDNGCETCAECTAKYGEAGEVAKNIPFNMPLYQHCEHCDGYHIGKLSKGVVEGKGYPKR